MKSIVWIAMILLLLVRPDAGERAAYQAITIWGRDVVPSLFPYMVLCQSLSSLEASSSYMRALPFIFGLLGGSPSASAALNVLAHKLPLSKRSLLLLAAFAGTISPMFFLGPTAKWFSSATIARHLLAAQYIGALLTGCVMSFLCRKKTQEDVYNLASEKHTHADPFARSIDAVLRVGGCIVLYSTAAEYLLLLLPHQFDGICEILHCTLEISGGLRALSISNLPLQGKAVLAAGACGFGGLSILAQNALFLEPIGVSKRELLSIAVLRGVFSSIAMALISLMKA